ncbi:hypothetical protein DCC39_06185 [Pueribacillus theae]|uniref:Uncharacterized protein n=1 Tax=Pueribacillus theae TaxID=2171751 RepID=A0A2U1K4D1_9BACI|nr:hypothetical protein [Pueribacillus theae]PWA12387.1 hypothetical protein DCC39_06185 [Pueribacillus theae]
MARPSAVIMKTGQKWNNGHDYFFIRASVGVSSYRSFTRKLSISMERGCHLWVSFIMATLIKKMKMSGL